MTNKTSANIGGGLLIESDGRKLITDRGQVEPGFHDWIVWANHNHPNYSDLKSSVWIPEPVDQYDDLNTSTDLMHKSFNSFNQSMNNISLKKNGPSSDKFNISQPYGEKHPRLVSNISNPKNYSTLIATTKDLDGFNKESQSHWTISMSNN